MENRIKTCAMLLKVIIPLLLAYSVSYWKFVNSFKMKLVVTLIFVACGFQVSWLI